MLSDVHEILGSYILHDISTQLDAMRSGNDSVATIAQNIIHTGSATIYFEDGGTHDPDIEFRYKSAQYPGVVIEIAYTQSGKDLQKLADHYIVESSGNIQTVIGISVNYQGAKEATLSIWHPKYGLDEQGEYLAAEETVVSQVYELNVLIYA